MQTVRTSWALLAVLCAFASGAGAVVMTGDQVIEILDQSVDWYRTLGTQQQAANQPSDLLILYANRQTADKVIALAFEIARANAELLSSQANATQNAGDAASSSQELIKLQSALEAQRLEIQTEMDADRRQLAASPKPQKIELQAKLSELQGELDLVSARKNLLDTTAEFVNKSDAKGADANALKAHIDAIAVSIPTGAAGTAPLNPAAAAGPAAPLPTLLAAGSGTPSRFGVWDLVSNVLRLSSKIDMIDAIDRRTAALQDTFARIRAPPLDQLKALSARGDALAAQADFANSASLRTVRDQFDTLAWLFKQTSDIVIPLSKEGVLLRQYRHNLKNWHDAVENQYHDALKTLRLRLGLLLALLAVVFAAAELWRRAVLRYVHDPRRRYQLLLLRKIAVWTLAVAIVGSTLATELSTFVTFAGLITAGLAVAMQSVLVSLVGYFFLIGKYGIRVGDRVQIGNVIGEVIDLGLVRMHLMELGGQGALGPTGRVVAFANSIVFQASGGLFKQIAGVNFTWHEITLTLPAGCDYAAVKETLLAAVRDALKDYREEFVRQAKEIQRTTASSFGGDPSPQVQLHFSGSGVEAQVRYPVHLQQASEIDERVSREAWKVLSVPIETSGAPAGGST